MDKITLYNTTDGNISVNIGVDKCLHIKRGDSYEVTQDEYNCIDEKIFNNNWLSKDPNQLITTAYFEDVTFKMFGNFQTESLNYVVQFVEAATGGNAKVSEVKTIESYNYIEIISDSKEFTNRNGLYCYV